MTEDEILKKLKELGIEQGEWKETKEGSASGLPILERQKEMLLKIRSLLEDKVEQDQKTVALLREKAKRMKHGGGH
jgi:hypothetical protein